MDSIRDDCPCTHLRLFHQQPEQTVDLMRALQGAGASRLEQLMLGDCDPEGAQALGSLLADSTAIKELTLQRVQDPQATLRALAPGLAQNESLSTLSVMACDATGAPGLCSLMQSLTQRRHALDSLSLHKCSRLDASVAAVLAQAVLAGAVRDVDLSECTFAAGAMQTLLQQLILHSSLGTPEVGQALRSLSLRSCSITAAAANSLADLMATSPSLTTLNLSGNVALGDAGAAQIARALAQCRTLRSLDLSGCEIGPEGCGQLAAGLAECPGLQRLALADNHVGAEGLLALAAALQRQGSNAGLQHLALDGNHIRGASLQQQQQLPPSLRSLSVSRNNLGDAGVAWLQLALAPCAHLSELDLSEASIFDAGATPFASLLDSHPQLSALQCSRNSMLGPGGYRLVAAVSRHPGLRSFKGDEARIMGEILEPGRAGEAGWWMSEKREGGAAESPRAG